MQIYCRARTCLRRDLNHQLFNHQSQRINRLELEATVTLVCGVMSLCFFSLPYSAVSMSDWICRRYIEQFAPIQQQQWCSSARQCSWHCPISANCFQYIVFIIPSCTWFVVGNLQTHFDLLFFVRRAQKNESSLTGEKKNDKNDEERRWKYRVIFFGGRQDYKINPAQPEYTYMFDFDTNWF